MGKKDLPQAGEGIDDPFPQLGSASCARKPLNRACNGQNCIDQHIFCNESKLSDEVLV